MRVKPRGDTIAAVAAEFLLDSPRFFGDAFAEFPGDLELRGAHEQLARTCHGCKTHRHEIGASRLHADGA